MFAYKLEGNLAKERNLAGQYLLVQKVDESTWHPGHTTPIVRVKITTDENFPSSAEGFDKLEYVQTWLTKYEDRFFPLESNLIKEEIAEKSKIKYEMDDFGYLPQFRVQLITTSKRVIPSKLIFAGNFPQTIPPKREFIPHSKLSIPSVFWKEFEKWSLEKYFYYNLREAKIYQR